MELPVSIIFAKMPN